MIFSYMNKPVSSDENHLTLDQQALLRFFEILDRKPHLFRPMECRTLYQDLKTLGIIPLPATPAF